MEAPDHDPQLVEFSKARVYAFTSRTLAFKEIPDLMLSAYAQQEDILLVESIVESFHKFCLSGTKASSDSLEYRLPREGWQEVQVPDHGYSTARWGQLNMCKLVQILKRRLGAFFPISNSILFYRLETFARGPRGFRGTRRKVQICSAFSRLRSSLFALGSELERPIQKR